MSNRVKTYFLVPGWDFPVGSIQLGSVILDLSYPQRALNSGKPITIDTIIHSSEKSNFKATVDRSKNRKIGLWAQFLDIFGLGSELSVQYDKDQVETYSLKQMRTDWFLPSKDFAQKSVQAPGVAELLEQMDYKRPVYLITGLKTVEGASVTTVKSKGRKLHAKFGFDGTSVAVPVTLGPEGEHISKESETVTFTNSSPIVFAFQLNKVMCKENKGIVQKEYTKGALFGVDEGENDLGKDAFDIEQTWEQGDSSKAISAVDENDGGVCYCIVPELQ